MILTEHLTHTQTNMIVERGDPTDPLKNKNLYMRGIFIQGGVRNHNGRNYPVSQIKNAVDKINKKIQEGESILGECDHPEGVNINIDRVSHKILNMWMEGNTGCGKLQIIPTPVGEIIRTLIESDVKLGVSSRGCGEVNDYGDVSNFDIVTVDIVANPSAPNAYPKPVYESLNAKRGAIIEDLARAIQHDPKAQKHLHKELLTWIDNLK